MVLDEVHEANKALSPYGMILPYVLKCAVPQRPRILALTASPSDASSNMRETIASLSTKLNSLPFSPILDDDKNTDEANDISTKYVEVSTSQFEEDFGSLIFETLDSLAVLHEFFKPCWKPFPPKHPLKSKVNAVIKITSRAEAVARNNEDVELQQLTLLMNKLVDAIDMLQIFGPRKLLEFMKADLDFAHKNESLGKVYVKVSPIILTLRLRIIRMETSGRLVEDSPRVTQLLALLKHHQSSQERILIFVERRNTAERLCRRLKTDPVVGAMNPDYVVGNASGGFPKEMQHAVLEKFQNGECQVVVATSVLEQGIDVAACGVVICFDGIKSLKSIIQSRGRARKKSASFIVFVNAEGQRKINEMTAMEILLNNVIVQLMRERRVAFDPLFAQEIEKFLDGSREEVAGAVGSNEEEDEESEDELELDLDEDNNLCTIQFFNHVDADSLKNHVRSFFKSPLDRVKVMKKRVIAQFDGRAGEVDRLNLIKDISTSVDKATDIHLRAWIETLTPGAQIQTNFTGEQFDLLTGFHFTNCLTVNLDSNFIWNENYWLTIDNKEIILSVSSSDPEAAQIFTLHPIDVDGPILINDNREYFEIFLCLKNPPSHFIGYELARFDFINRPFNLYLKRNEPIKVDVLQRLLNTLQNFSMEIYNVCHLKVNVEQIRPSGIVNSLDPQYFKKAFMIKTWHSKHAAVLPLVLPEEFINRFLACSSIIVLQMLLDVTIPTRFQHTHVQLVREFKLPFPENEPPKYYATIARVKITPNRIIYKQMLPVQTNRIFRYFPDPENFLMVSFADEHDGNPWRSSNVYDYFLSVLEDGITIAGKHYTFLGCSNSQLREAHCWFSCLDRQEVYRKIGTFPENWSAGRKLSRIALAFASSIDTVTLNHALYLQNVAPDIESPPDVCFSDGIGRGSVSLFKEVRNILNIPQSISAFQIRVGGVKGVISIFDQREHVTFRKSMKKFESDHAVLEVLGYSRPIKLTLNRHVILMLSSFGVPDEVFLDLQTNELDNCLEALTHDEKSLGFVRSRSKIFDWEMFAPDQIVHEPFFRQLLFNNVIESVSYLVDHAHVTVEKGRVLMGVLDETGTLNYGEVYAHVVDDGIDMEISGQVLVFRNPCVLPSDIRLLTARTANLPPRFKALYRNCLVVPSRGPASHAHECSGGDLDGDLYYIIWDEQLIPPELQAPGEQVVDVTTTELYSPAAGNSDRDMMKFFCDYNSNNRLGMIANAHLASSDKVGMRDARSVQLARYVTAETDAPKKGLTVGALPEGLMPEEYPDYMNKRDKIMYRSETILGELFRQACPLLEQLMDKRVVLAPPSRINLNVVSDSKSIDSYYTLYSFEIAKLMQSFDLESEVDLFSGTPIWRRGYMSAYKQQTQLRQTVFEVVSDFWKKWRTRFDEWLQTVANDQTKIVEWYRRPSSSRSPVQSFSMLAFPYVEFEEKASKAIVDKMQVSTQRWIYFNKLKWGGEWRARYNVGMTIMQQLEGFECHFYGSSMLGLSEEYSDIDICASGSLVKVHELLKHTDRDAALLTKPHTCVTLNNNNFPVEVTNFLRGVQKTYAFAETFDEHPYYWPSLRVLIEWARTVGIVKSTGSEGIITVVSFCHLFIYFVTDKPPRTTTNATPYTLARFNNWIESLKDSACGSYIYEFLKTISNRKNKSWISSKTDPLSGEKLIKGELIDELAKSAAVAIYILTIHDGDVMKLFQFCSKKRLYRLHKKYLNPTHSPGQKQQNFSEIKAKCNPKKNQDLTFELRAIIGFYYLEVTGDQKYFFFVEQGLNRIQNKFRLTRHRGLQRQVYHILNGTIIIPENGSGLESEVTFTPYLPTQYHPHHTGMMKSVFKIRNTSPNTGWRVLEYKRFTEQFIQQFNRYKSKQNSAKHGNRLWRFFGDICKFDLF